MDGARSHPRRRRLVERHRHDDPFPDHRGDRRRPDVDVLVVHGQSGRLRTAERSGERVPARRGLRNRRPRRLRGSHRRHELVRGRSVDAAHPGDDSCRAGRLRPHRLPGARLADGCRPRRTRAGRRIRHPLHGCRRHDRAPPRDRIVRRRVGCADGVGPGSHGHRRVRDDDPSVLRRRQRTRPGAGPQHVGQRVRGGVAPRPRSGRFGAATGRQHAAQPRRPVDRCDDHAPTWSPVGWARRSTSTAPTTASSPT